MIINYLIMAFIIYCCKDVLRKNFWLKNYKLIVCFDNALKLAITCIVFILLIKQFNLTCLNTTIVAITFVLVLIKSMVWYTSFQSSFTRQLDFNDFMVHLGMYFKENKRIETSLNSCFEFSNHHRDLERLIIELHDKEEKETILSSYHSHYLWKSLTVIMLNHEQHGDHDLDLRIESNGNDILKFSQNIRIFKKEILGFISKLDLACVLSIVIALVSKNMLKETINIETNVRYQSSMTIFLMLNLMILLLNHSLFKTKPNFVEECL